MASYARRERTTTWVEYSLPSPTVWGQVHRVIAAIQSELGDQAEWDDACEVIANDGQIIFRYEKKATGRG